MISNLLVWLTLFITTSAYVPPTGSWVERKSGTNTGPPRQRQHVTSICAASATRKKTSNEVRTRVRQNNEERFHKWVGELRKFKEEHGHFRVPTASNRSLSNFMQRQRHEYKRWLAGESSRLDDDRVAKLESIGFPWTVTGQSQRRPKEFDKRVEELLNFKKEHGHFRVPPTNKSLSNFVRNTRWEHKRWLAGEHSRLDDDRVAKLESIGFPWTVTGQSRRRPKDEEKFDKRVEELLNFKRESGNFQVARSNKRLSNFVRQQRQEYKRWLAREHSTLDDDRVAKLESVGFPWMSEAPQASFHESLQLLKNYKKKYGDCNVPWKWEENLKLGRFVARMRREYKKYNAGEKSTMNKERIKALESIGFQWTMEKEISDRNTRHFYENLGSLNRYKEEHGDCNVPARSKKDPQLANFVSTMRTEYRKLNEGKRTSMNEERIKALESIGFQWNRKQDVFRENVESLKSYKEDYGDCNVPQGWKDNPKLGYFVRRMRTEYKKLNAGEKSYMTEDRIRALESIGFQWKLR